MTGIQSRDESVGDSSDDEPLSKMVKPGKKCSEDTSSDILEDASPKKPLKEPTPDADDGPGHSTDDEPLSKLVESKGSKRSIKPQETEKLSDSEEDQPLIKIIKKKKQKADTEESEDARKTRSPQKRKAVTKAPKSSPSPSPSPVKFTQRKGRKGKNDSKKKASAQATAMNATPKRRERAKKEAVCGDSSGDEASSKLPRKRSEPAMKQAVVLLERMSEREVRDAVARGRAHGQEQKAQLWATRRDYIRRMWRTLMTCLAGEICVFLDHISDLRTLSEPLPPVRLLFPPTTRSVSAQTEAGLIFSDTDDCSQSVAFVADSDLPPTVSVGSVSPLFPMLSPSSQSDTSSEPKADLRPTSPVCPP